MSIQIISGRQAELSQTGKHFCSRRIEQDKEVSFEHSAQVELRKLRPCHAGNEHSARGIPFHFSRSFRQSRCGDPVKTYTQAPLGMKVTAKTDWRMTETILEPNN
jgi:hypothetical protein